MKEKIDRCRALIAAIYGGTARRKDEVELCELLPEVLDAAENITQSPDDYADENRNKWRPGL